MVWRSLAHAIPAAWLVAFSSYVSYACLDLNAVLGSCCEEAGIRSCVVSQDWTQKGPL